MVSVPVKKASIDYSYSELDGFKFTFEVGEGYTHSANTIKKLIESGVPLEFTLKKPSADKTEKQIATAWAAMNEMAKALELSVNEVYRRMIRDYGKADFIIVPKQEADRIILLHSQESSSRGNFGEIVGPSKKDPDCTVVKLYWGCSYYNKEEMSQFIDGINHEYEEMFE